VIPYGRHDIDESDVEAVARTLGGDWLTTGPAVTQFETDLQAVTGGVPVVAVSSGTAALHTAYAAAGFGLGDEVITPPLTFVATQAAAVHLGATPVFADVLPDSGLIDPEAVEAAITARTVAIVAVDYAGHPADMDALRAIADRRSLLLIEDAAHSLGSILRGRPVGSLADLTTFSFFPTKNVTTGEGGAVAAIKPELLAKARLFSHQGLVRDPAQQVRPEEGPWNQEVHDFGLNYRLPDILAALGSSQLKRLPEFKAHRQWVKSIYDEMLTDPRLGLPWSDQGAEPVWHLYPLRVPSDRRRQVFDELKRREINVQVNYIPAYWHPAFDQNTHPLGLCPVAEEFYAREISLPMHTRITEDEARWVATSVIEALN
jgi:dTDP-4-amino-4,6-dideoxygalactose transaminase